MTEPTSTADRSGHAVVLLVLAALLVGFALRLTARDVHSLWFDEAATLFVAEAEEPFAELRRDRHPPLSHLAFRGWGVAFGWADGTLRLLTALVSCVSLLAFARLALRWCSPSGAAFGVWLLAVGPRALWMAHEVRMYAFVELGAVVALSGAAAARDGRPRRAFVGALIGTAIAFGSHYYGVLVAAAAGAASLVPPDSAADRERGTVGRVLPVASGAALGLAVWVPWLVTSLAAQLDTPWGFQAKASPRDLVELPIRLLLVDVDVVPGAARPFVWGLGGLVLAGVVGGLWRALRPADSPGRGAARVAAAAAFAPVAVAGVLALVGPPNFLPKYLIAAAPGVILCVAHGVGAFPVGRIGRFVAGAAIVIGCLAITLLHREGNRREDYRGACAAIVERWQPGDRIVSVTGTVTGFEEHTVRHYLRARPELATAVVGAPRTAEERETLASAARLHVVYRANVYAESALAEVVAERAELDRRDGPFSIRYLLVGPRE